MKIEISEEPEIVFSREVRECSVTINDKEIKIVRTSEVERDAGVTELSVEVDSDDVSKLTDEETEEVQEFIDSGKISW